MTYSTCQNVYTLRSPDMLAPAKIPVAAGKKMANTEKNDSPSLNSGPKFSLNGDRTESEKRRDNC